MLTPWGIFGPQVFDWTKTARTDPVLLRSPYHPPPRARELAIHSDNLFSVGWVYSSLLWQMHARINIHTHRHFIQYTHLHNAYLHANRITCGFSIRSDGKVKTRLFEKLVVNQHLVPIWHTTTYTHAHPETIGVTPPGPGTCRVISVPYNGGLISTLMRPNLLVCCA